MNDSWRDSAEAPAAARVRDKRTRGRELKLLYSSNQAVWPWTAGVKAALEKERNTRMASVKTNISKFMAMLAVAMLTSLFCVGNAFAIDVSVTFPLPSTEAASTSTQTVQIDQANVQNSSAAPVVGMFYKNGAWNVLVTGTDANQYASWSSILDKAVLQYNQATYVDNTTNYITVSQVNAAATQQKLTLTAADGPYTKYYPQGVDLDGATSTGAGYFFNKATNADTTLTTSLFDASYVLTSSLNGVNPNGVGPVFAWKYATAVTPDSYYDEDEGETVIGTAGYAAQQAAPNVASATAQTAPRLIMGCATGMTDSNAMGKRYCFDVTGIVLS